jgi:alginate O-acetyltransferase complex protein AlgI
LANVLEIPISESAYLNTRQLGWIALALLVVWGTPNTQQWMRRYQTALNQRLRPDWVEQMLPWANWRPSLAFGIVIGCVATFAVVRTFSQAPTEFLYFQF